MYKAKSGGRVYPASTESNPAQLSWLHGTLIALGCLKFELSGKVGVQYQLTTLGRQTLERGLVVQAETE